MTKKNTVKLYNFEFGSVTLDDNLVTLKISKDQFTDINDVDDLITDQNDLFLNRQKVVENETELVFTFKKSSSTLKSLMEIKQEDYPVKSSIAKRILEQDILNEYLNDDIYISLNPATLFYYPMETVRYTYSANSSMPRNEYTALERYKALVAYIFSGIPYEKCLNSPNDVSSEGNDLIKEIYTKNSRIELLQFVKDTNNFITYDYISKRQQETTKYKKLLYIVGGSLALLTIAGIITTQTVASNQQIEMAQAYETQIDNKDKVIEADDLFQQGKYEEAIALYQDTDLENSDIAEKLIHAGEYQLAINVDNSQLETVIQKLYDNGNQNQVTDLKADQLNTETSEKLKNEKSIVAGDENAMLNILNFLNDENTAERLALKYQEKDDTNHIEQIAKKYPDNQVIQDIVNETNINKQKQDLQKEIDDLKKQADDEDDDNRKKDLENQIKSLEDELNNL